MVKATDSKSVGSFPRRFESCRVRILLASLFKIFCSFGFHLLFSALLNLLQALLAFLNLDLHCQSHGCNGPGVVVVRKTHGQHLVRHPLTREMSRLSREWQVSTSHEPIYTGGNVRATADGSVVATACTTMVRVLDGPSSVVVATVTGVNPPH